MRIFSKLEVSAFQSWSSFIRRSRGVTHQVGLESATLLLGRIGRRCRGGGSLVGRSLLLLLGFGPHGAGSWSFLASSESEISESLNLRVVDGVAANVMKVTRPGKWRWQMLAIVRCMCFLISGYQGENNGRRGYIVLYIITVGDRSFGFVMGSARIFEVASDERE